MTGRKPAKKPAPKAPQKAAKAPSTAVTIHAGNRAPAAPATFLEFLDRAARDPGFDVEKFKAVLEIKAREDARAAESRFDDAMTHAQSEMKHVRADMENKQTKSRYASYPKLDAAIRPIYTRHGFAVSFDTEPLTVPDMVRVVAYVSCAGHKSRRSIDIPADGKGAKGGDVMTKTHATTSAVTTGMRNLLRMIFNLVTSTSNPDDIGHDDDGNAAGGTPEPTAIDAEQVKILQGLMAKNGHTLQRVLNYVNLNAKLNPPITMLTEIPGTWFDRIRTVVSQ